MITDRKQSGFGARFDRSVGRGIVVGSLAGIAAAVAMILLAMVANVTYRDVGFFTPLYHIASAFTSPDAMMASMEHAQSGDLYHFVPGAAATGLAIHLGFGASLGAFFGAIVALGRLQRSAIVAAGVVFGFAVLAVMSWIVLPVTADLFGGGKPISEMPTMAGLGTFIGEHALFGFLLGLLSAAALGRRTRQEVTSRASDRRAA